MNASPNNSSPAVGTGPGTWLRAAFGGTLMGLANLVPGISGGTMLLAAGIYPQFIEAISEVTRLRLRMRPLLLLAVTGGAAVLGILLLAGLLRDLVVEQRFVMYSLFIGLTLGGVPLVWRLARPADKHVYAGAVAGFLAMAGLSVLQNQNVLRGSEGHWGLLFVAGLAGASAMILPGISGGYLLLLLGQYVPILSGIDQLKTALSERAWNDVTSVGLSVILPVGLGVVIGVVVVSNLLRFLLERYEKATLGVLLGLLLGSVVGLWPFRQQVEPVPGETVIKGQVVTQESLQEIDPEDYPTAPFSPSGAQLALSLGLIVAGFGATTLIGRLGADDSPEL